MCACPPLYVRTFASLSFHDVTIGLLYRLVPDSSRHPPQPTSTSTSATLVHASVTPRRDYCSTLYVGLPAVRLGCLERVIRTAARLIGGIPRTGHVSAFMLDVLHWLPL